MARRTSRDARIAALRRKYPEGLTSTQVIAEASIDAGYEVSLPTFAKYIQRGFVDVGRRRRVAKGAGSIGAYPPATVIQLAESCAIMDARRRGSKAVGQPWPRAHYAQVETDSVMEAVERLVLQSEAFIANTRGKKPRATSSAGNTLRRSVATALSLFREGKTHLVQAIEEPSGKEEEAEDAAV